MEDRVADRVEVSEDLPGLRIVGVLQARLAIGPGVHQLVVSVVTRMMLGVVPRQARDLAADQEVELQENRLRRIMVPRGPRFALEPEREDAPLKEMHAVVV